MRAKKEGNSIEGTGGHKEGKTRNCNLPPCTSLPSTTNDYAAACWLVHAQLPSHDGEGHSDLESEEILNLATRKIKNSNEHFGALTFLPIGSNSSNHSF